MVGLGLSPLAVPHNAPEEGGRGHVVIGLVWVR